MKIAVFFLLGYITCTLKCEVNKTEAENRTQIARSSDTLVPSGNLDEPVGAEQHVMTIDAVDPPDDTRPPQNLEMTDFLGKNKVYEVSIRDLHWKDSTLPVDTKQSDYDETTKDPTLPVDAETIDDYTLPVDTDTIDNSSLPVDAETIDDSTLPVDTEQTDYVDYSTLPVDTDTIDDSTLPVDTDTIDDSTSPVDAETIDDSTLPVNTDQPKKLETSRKVPEDVKITTASAAAPETTHTVYANTISEAIHTTKRSDFIIQAYDTGPAKIKVVDALKILEMSKSKYALASIALIHRLEWLRSTYNITELVIDHKVELREFDEMPNTEISSNASKLLRSRTIDEDFVYVKDAIINATNTFAHKFAKYFKII